MKTDDIEKLMLSDGITGLSMAYMETGHSLQSFCAGYADQVTRRTINSSTAFHACSMSKLVTAFLILTLVSKDKLPLDANVNDLLCKWKLKDTYYNAPSLRQLLQHQGGIIDPEHSFPALPFDSALFSTAELLEGTTIACARRIVTEQEPSTVFSYSDAGYMIVQLALEDIYNKPFKALMETYVLDPLGMKNSFYHDSLRHPFAYGHQNLNPIPSLYPYYPYDAACGLWTTPTDAMKLVVAFHESLKGSSSAFIDKQDAEELLQSNSEIPYAGLGVFLESIEGTVEYSALGWGEGFQCLLAGKPETGDALICMINTDPGKHQMETILGDIYKRSSLARK
ncbi:serine hydrolase domain-containing protein [Terribacillus aidingensis]|uniref:serine hydrolase domain-containing protein n=1 Tax=Terribacillus aidingensis TaxID=586416 RepID=UPI00344E483F